MKGDTWLSVGLESTLGGNLEVTGSIPPTGKIRNTNYSLTLDQVIINGLRTIYPCGLDKGFSLKFCVGSRVQHEPPEQGQKAYKPKCEYNNEDEDNSPNILGDKNYQTSSQKFRQITCNQFFFMGNK